MPTKSLPRPVISVGNLTLGGTGKTPTSLWLAQQLAEKGYQVAILTRGYKRVGRSVLILQPEPIRPLEMDARESDQAGDEACMMARLFGQRVGVGRNRYHVGMRLLRSGDVDVFILDDGFQHRRLRRDLDLVLLGSDSNGWLLPAGPFREPISSLQRAHLFLIASPREKWVRVVNEDTRGGNRFFGALESRCLVSWEDDQWREYPLSLMAGAKITAVAGIAKPELFYRMISDWQGDIVEVIEFEDHHAYASGDWNRINRAARKSELIITTEKDILKLLRFPFAKKQLFALRVEMVVDEGEKLVAAVEKRLQEKMKMLRSI